MNKLVGLFLILMISSSGAHYGIFEGNEDEDLDVDDPEIDPAFVEEPGCPVVSALRNITIKEILGQWHLPFMSNRWVDHMSKSMHGNKGAYTKTSIMGTMCIKVNVKELGPEEIPDDSEATIWLQSKCPRSAAEWNLGCTPYETLTSKWHCHDLKSKTPDEDSFVYIADTDEKTWALVIRCIPNSGQSWAIFSKVKKLDTPIVKSLLQKVETMGFKLFDVEEVPYEKCMTKPQ